MAFPNTETTGSSVWTEQGWEFFFPLSISALVLDTPIAVEIRDAAIYGGPIGDLHLVQKWHGQTITAQTHQHLLDQSIQEYREIWRTLAGE